MKKKLSILFTVLTLIVSLFSGLVVRAEESASSEDAVSGASVGEYTDPSTLAESYDIVIIGAGGGGLAAAIAAKDAGANVAIFEKMPVAGGNTMKSSAGMNASETKFQKEQGIEDKNDDFFAETLKGGKETNDQELLRFFVDNSAAAIEWLDSLGIRLNNLTTTGGMSVQRTHRPEDGSAVGGYLVEGLVRNVTERNIPLFTNANVVEILQNEGAASGVKVEIGGETKEVQAKAVIIATGGFGANLSMVSELKPELDGFVTTNQEGSTGDGIKMAQALGAEVVDLDKIQIHPTVEQESAYLITEAVRGEGAILVSQEGKRFFNELETRDKVSAAIIELPEHYAYVIADDALKGRVKAVNKYEEKGLVVKADTIEELAAALEVPAENLTATLEAWNASVEAKEDTEFGRTTGMDNALTTAPYYAIKIAPGVHHTMGGLKINTNAQVLNADGEPIKGLYASGEVTGGIHGSNRIGGNAVADIIIFGRQAGMQSAEAVKE
ncbi:flavocytochrome c [Aerococcaceae bacterium NML171108]|nr:flavocytochrome c [Aerococcaceae bacterium NML171108]